MTHMIFQMLEIKWLITSDFKKLTEDEILSHKHTQKEDILIKIIPDKVDWTGK